MITTPLWQVLKNLVTLDNEILAVESLAHSTQHKLSQERKALEHEKDILKIALDNVNQAKKAAQLAELNLQEVNTALTRKKKQYDLCITAKESQACEHEITRLTLEQAVQETIVLDSWDFLQKTSSQLHATESSLSIEHTQRLATVQQLESELNAQMLAATNDKNKRSEISAQVSPEWLNRYESMRETVKNPIVPVTQSSCSSCFYTITAQDLMRIKRSGLLPCKSCYRLLYSEDESSAKESTHAI